MSLASRRQPDRDRQRSGPGGSAAAQPEPGGRVRRYFSAGDPVVGGDGQDYGLPDMVRVNVLVRGFSEPGDGDRPAAARILFADAIAALVGSRLADVESALIAATVRRYRGSIQMAAVDLGVSPSTLYRKRASWSEGAEAEPPE